MTNIEGDACNPREPARLSQRGVLPPKGMTPTYYGQRDNGCHEWEKMPIFMAFLSAYPLSNLLVNGPPDDRPGIRKKAVCVSGRNAIHFRVWVVPG
jgi:hypothetical protein